MASFSTNEIIDIIFIPIFVVLLGFNIINLFKHSLHKKAAYIFLIIFDVVRIAGNVVLVIGYETSKGSNVNIDTVTDLFTAGYIMQGIGYGFILSSTMSFYNRAIGYDKKEEKEREKMTGKKAKMTPSRLFHLVNLVATILLISGLTNSDDAFSPNGNGTVDTLAKAGSFLYCGVTALLMIMTFYHLFIKGSITNASRIILTFILVALIPMAMRAGYSTYRFESNSITQYNVWVHLIFQNIVEVLSVVVYLVLGFYLHAKGGDEELDERKVYFNTLEQGRSTNNDNLNGEEKFELVPAHPKY